MNGRILTRVRQRCYFCVLVAFVLASVGQPMMPVVAAPALDDSASLEKALVSAQLGFLSAPIVGEPAELVLAVSTTVPAGVSTQIVLPDAIQVLAGSLTGQADLSPGIDWRQAVIVRVASEGEFKITASIEGTQADGSPVSGQAHLYLAANTEMASASELPVAIAADVIVSPPDPESEFSVEAAQDGDEMSADPTPNQITMGDNTSAEPAVEFAGPDADVQVQENQDEVLLDPDDERDLITLGDETPSVPKTGEHVFEGVLVSEEAAELQLDEQADLVTLDDDSADEPGVTTDIGFRQEQEETATLNRSIYLPFVVGSATDTPASEDTEPWEEPLDAADDVGVEGESAGQERALLAEKSGLLTLGDDSPAEPQVVAGVGDDLEITPEQNVSETTRTVDSQTTLIVPEDDPSAPPEEVEAAVQEAGIEAENGGQELAVDVDAAAGWITQGDDSPTEPQRTPGLDVEAEITSEQSASEVTPNAGPQTILNVPEDAPSAEPEEVEAADQEVEAEGGGHELSLTKDPQVEWITQGEDGWPLVTEEKHTALPDVNPSPDPPTVAERGESVNAPQAGVDLVVEDIWSTTNPLTAGEWENVTFRIKNQGTASTSTTFYTKLWVDSTLVGTWYTNGLSAGYSATGSVNVKVTSAGWHTMKAQVDATSAVPEMNEANNIRTERWYWNPSSGGVDLVIEDTWSTTNPLTAGDWENVTFRIKNQGTAATSFKFYVKMWVDSTTIATWYANGLRAGQSATGSTSVKVATPGTHQVKVQVDTTNAVAETNEANNVRTESWTWPSPSGVDLVVEDLWSTTSPPQQGDWERILFCIRNRGDKSTPTKFYTRMWVDSTVVGTWYTNGLGAGYSAIGSVYVKVASAGWHTVKAQVDTTNAVLETDEANNVRTERWYWNPATGVDLVVEDMWSTTNPLTAGDWENVTFRIKNRGTAATSTRFYTRMWVDSTLLHTWYTDGLGAGYSATGSVSVKVASAGLHTVKVQVDTTSAVSETDETNNVRTETWRWDSGGVDLTVEDMWSTTTPLRTGEWERIYFRIKNRGTASTSFKFYIKMWVDSTSIATWYANGLGAGCSATGAVYVKVASAGLHTVKVQVDTTNAVAETDEANNVRTETWRWDSGGVDLIVEDVWSTTNPLTAGEWENITFRIKNQGTASTSFKFYTKMWVGSTHVGTWYTNGLNAGHSATGAINVKVSTPGSYPVKVQVDATNTVPESSETNNARTETWSWGSADRADLVVEDIWSTTAPLTGGQWENVTFRVKNQGTAPASLSSYGGLSSRLEAFGTEPGGQVEIRWDDQTGTPSLIAGDIATAAAPDGSSEAVAMSFFETYAPLYRMTDPEAELALQEVSQDDLGMTHVRYAQTYQGIQVFGADLVAHMTAEGKVTAVNGTYLPDLDLSPQPAISPEAALETARTHVGVPQAVSKDPPEMVIYQHGPTAHLAWYMRLTSDDPPGAWVYFIDAHDGQFVTMYEDIHFARNRMTYTANNTTSLPGTLLIQESTPSHSDAVAWAAHVNAGKTYDYYHDTHGRDSFDNKGATLVSTVHYKTSYNNAFWTSSGKQVVYGDGDGVRFGPLGNALDVVAHEWTHAVTQHEANLVYRREPGALNESYSDVFAAMVDRDDWLIGEDVYTPGTPGDALRSMADPPKYNQPDHVDHSLFKTYPWWESCTSSNDQCGVHTNSGVPNKAAHLLAAGGTHHGITVQGIGRSKTERIYYRALTEYLTSSSDFKQARDLTVQACGDLYGKDSTECRAVQDAFAAVGIGTESRFYTRLYIDGKAIYTWYADELEPGVSAIGSVNLKQDAGSHVLKVHVDYTNVVDEPNEANNVRTETWAWQ
jgi:bacillolysin